MPSRKRLALDEAGVRAYARLASGVAHELERIIEIEDLKRSDVARMTGLDKAALTRILDGTRNLELRTIAAVLSAAGYVMDVKAKPTTLRLPSEMRNDTGESVPSGGPDSPRSPAPVDFRTAVNVDARTLSAQATATPYAASASGASFGARPRVLEAQS